MADVSPREDASRPSAQLGLWDAVSIIIGIVVGAGIYETPPLIFRNVPGPWTGLAVWIIAGGLSLVGALCYAELATAYPRSGGDYVYLTRAYAPSVGFLYGWAQLAVILTGSIGMMAYIFADYAVKIWPGSSVLYASAAIVVLSILNLLGVAFGKRTQNLLTLSKVLGLGGILVAGLFWGAPSEVGRGTTPLAFESIAFAMVLVFITYGGWNDAAYVAADVHDGRRNIPRSLILGTVAITAIYLVVNVAYLWGLGFEGVRNSSAVAVDVLAQPLGKWGATAMSLLVMISALGAVNGLIFTGSRLYSAVGTDHSVFAWLGRWHPRLGTPVGALLAQAIISGAMVIAVGTSFGQSGINALVGKLTGETVAWEGRGGFELLLRCTAPVFWLFFLLTAISLFVLRVRERNVERPFTVPFYPWVPLLFCLTCGYMLYSAVLYAGMLGLVGGSLLVIGLPFYWMSRRTVPIDERHRHSPAVSLEGE